MNGAGVVVGPVVAFAVEPVVAVVVEPVVGAVVAIVVAGQDPETQSNFAASK